MIYFASFFNSKDHRGQIYAISNSIPRDINCLKLSFFFPDWEAVKSWKDSAKTDNDWNAFVQRYRNAIARNKPAIREWLNSLDPSEDITLCCWERSPHRCHRSLVSQLVQAWKSEFYGGLK